MVYIERCAEVYILDILFQDSDEIFKSDQAD